MIYIVAKNSPKFPGGIEQVIGRLVENFSTKENYTIICGDSNEGESFFYKQIKCVSLPVKGCFILDKLFLYSRLVFSYKATIFLKNNIKNADIIHVHEGAGVGFFIGLTKKIFFSENKLIVTLHNSTFSLYSDFAKRLPGKFILLKLFLYVWRWYAWIFEKVCMESADSLVFLTKKTRSYCEKEYKITKNVAIITNGLHSGHNEPSNNDNKVPVGLIVGALVYMKGLDVAVAAIKKINEKHIKLQLIVVGFEDYRKYFKQNFSNFVSYAGVVNSNKIGQYYGDSDFLVLPSRSEDMPLVIMEALQAGIPFIVSSACNTEEFDPERKFGIVVDGWEVEKWRSAIEFMARGANCAEFKKNISSHDFSEYEWGNIAKKYEDIYAEVSSPRLVRA